MILMFVGFFEMGSMYWTCESDVVVLVAVGVLKRSKDSDVSGNRLCGGVQVMASG